MKKRKVSIKQKIATVAEIILLVFFGVSGILCVAYGIDRDWIGFSIYLVAAIASIFVIIPLHYFGEIYECPKCGQKFKVNPYKVFFTNFFYFDFLNGVYASKRKKLKCPHCKTKEWCKCGYDLLKRRKDMGDDIRLAEADEFGQILEIWKAENIKAHGFIPSRYWEENYAAVAEVLPRAEVYVCVRSGEITGFAGLNGDYIEGIFVKSEMQRNGTGSALLNKLKSVKPKLTLKVYKKNSNAISFYLKNGFETLSEGVDENTGESEFLMQWKKDTD